jgi:hypothetical protein
MSESEPRVEPVMESAGAELMALSFRLEKSPEFAADAARVREIGAWASFARQSDMEKAMLQILGSMMDAMRRRNFAFSEELPIGAQFRTFLDGIPDPLPGEIGHVDQATLPPSERRDVFEARIESADVRRWTGGDGVERSIAVDATVTPEGVTGVCSVYAEGDATPLLVDGAVLKLRSAGGALKVVGQAEAPAA